MILCTFKASLICRDKKIIFRDHKQREGRSVFLSKVVTILSCVRLTEIFTKFYSKAFGEFSRCARIQIPNDADFNLFYETISLILILGQLSYSPKKGQQLARELFYFLSTEKYLIYIHNSNITRGLAITAKQRRSGRFLF
jgi:hypothetical protein